jgi:hypothetical protein
LNAIPSLAALIGLSLSAFAASAAAAEQCPQKESPIDTDRSDVTNSSVVVPQGSFQNENGINFSQRDGGRAFDGTDTRLRWGVAPCLEILVDVPTYIAALRAPLNSGFTDVAPAIKWQISPLPGKIDLSATLGAGLPTGTKAIGVSQKVASDPDLLGGRNSPCGRGSIAGVMGSNANTEAFRCVPRNH